MRLETEYFRLDNFALQRQNGNTDFTTFTKADELSVIIEIDSYTDDPLFNLGYALYTQETNACLWWSFMSDAEIIHIGKGRQCFRSRIPPGLLNDGNYRIELLAALHNRQWIVGPGQYGAILNFTITGGNIGTPLFASTNRSTLLMPAFPWKVSNE